MVVVGMAEVMILQVRVLVLPQGKLMQVCEVCEEGELQFVEESPPYVAECFICPVCDSTYCVETYIEFKPEF